MTIGNISNGPNPSPIPNPNLNPQKAFDFSILNLEK